MQIETVRAFNKKQMRVIFKIAFLEALALSLIIPSASTSGNVAPQTGSVNVTISSGTGAGVINVNFGRTYPNPPFITLTPRNSPIGISKFGAPVVLHFVNDGVATTWNNMPTTQSELFGDTNGEHWVRYVEGRSLDTNGQFILCATMLTTSNNATASLRLQYSPDTGVTWFDADTVSDVLIDGTLGTSVCGADGHLPVAAKVFEVFFRVVGLNGGGIGDIPSFYEIYVTMRTDANPQNNVYVPYATSITITGFTLSVVAIVKPTSNQVVTIEWMATLD